MSHALITRKANFLKKVVKKIEKKIEKLKIANTLYIYHQAYIYSKVVFIHQEHIHTNVYAK